MKTRQKPQGPGNDEHPPKKMKSLQEASEPIAEMGAEINEPDAANSEGCSDGMPLTTLLGKGLQGMGQESLRGTKEHVAATKVGKVGKTQAASGKLG
ncbi:unnamed protein product [Sphagnum jensenii]|uniref:Uncharacterized protein n=1 Tax=Sphagnum jensenii TaxID=128206 RepID=A0ABP1BSS1_9BRYO